MAGTDYLFQGSAPPAITTAGASSNGLPEWYQQYLQGIAGKGVEIAGAGNPVPQQSVIGLSTDETNAAQSIRENAGNWQPGMTGALQTAGSALPGVNSAVTGANAAVAGPTGNFTQSYKQYMSPYTEGVVENIGREGQRNWTERIMPSINGGMIGSGNFGSTRNADALARAGRDVAADITGKQATALDAGYRSAADIFASDQARAQQQQQMQAGTYLTGANTLASATQGAAAQQGALTQAQAALGLGDAQALAATGQQWRSNAQAGLDAAYNNQIAQNNAPWDDLNRLNSITRGMQLPTTQTAVTNGPSQVYQPGALQTVGAAYGSLRS